jgi:hypothetical protein
MKERPILFSAPMVRAILEGRKTQTRRVVKPQPSPSSDSVWLGTDGIWRFSHPTLRGPVSHEADDVRCPYGYPGDRLWVRETIELQTLHGNNFPSPVYSSDGAHVMDGNGKASNHEFMRRRVTPSIHMPRWASRILLEVVSVRVERLQEISEADAKAEGVDGIKYFGLDRSNTRAYSELWESINGPESWDANPWVWCVEFKRVTA